MLQQLGPLVEAWRAVEVEKVQATETNITKRQYAVSVTLAAVVAVVAGLAALALHTGQGATAEKIVIGLLAFLGGIGARR